MSSAGWVSTTLNYIWPFIFVVLSFIPLYNNDIKRKTPIWQYIIYIILLIYSVNQEQMCMIVLWFNVLYLIYSLVNNKKLNIYNLVCILLSLASLLFIITCPGNQTRTMLYEQAVYPNFNKLNLFDKIYLGIIPTFENLINNKIVILIFIILLSIAAYKYGKNNLSKVVSLINVIFILSITIFKNEFINMFPFTKKLFTVFKYNGITNFNIIPFIICIIIYNKYYLYAYSYI